MGAVGRSEGKGGSVSSEDFMSSIIVANLGEVED
jgi:hypothetical protein